AVVALAGRLADDAARFVSLLADGTLLLTEVALQTHFLSGETSVTDTRTHALDVRLGSNERPAFVLMDPLQEWIYLVGASGETAVLRRSGDEFVINQRLRLTDSGERVTALRFLTGGISLLVGTDRGRVLQWFPVRDAGNDYHLQRVRHFEAPVASAVTAIATEYRRKGFV